MPSPAAKAEEMKRRYQREAVITATPAARLNMLFDKMILELGQADNGFEQDDLKAINDGLCRAQDILLALRGTLRTDLWAGANDLSQLYFALYKELLEANMQKNRDKAQRVLGSGEGSGRGLASGGRAGGQRQVGRHRECGGCRRVTTANISSPTRSSACITPVDPVDPSDHAAGSANSTPWRPT